MQLIGLIETILHSSPTSVVFFVCGMLIVLQCLSKGHVNRIKSVKKSKMMDVFLNILIR